MQTAPLRADIAEAVLQRDKCRSASAADGHGEALQCRSLAANDGPQVGGVEPLLRAGVPLR